MPTRHRRRSRLAFLLLPFCLTLVAAYFGWQSTRGTYSHAAREALRVERMEREAVLQALVKRREGLEEKVRRLRTDALDADLLDERARANLNMAHGNELVIFHRTEPGALPALAARTR